MPQNPPATLPANFKGWDQSATSSPPASLPADFNQWDKQSSSQGSMADDAHAEISARKGGTYEWLQDLESDIRNGSNATAVGRFLHKIGMQPTSAGTSQGAEEIVASPLIGATHIYQGAANPNDVQGAKQIVKGGLEMATLPSAFAAPEGAEAAAQGLDKAGAAINRLRPSVMREGASELFGQIAKDANKVPVTLDNAQDAALKLMDWQKKTQLGPTVNKFLNRVTNPKMGPLTYEEARDFYSLLTRMSADETMKMAPPVKYQLQRMTAGLRTDIGNAAGTVGKAADYYKAMGDYAQAAKLQDWIDLAKKYAVRGALAAAGGGLVGAGAHYINEGLTQ